MTYLAEQPLLARSYERLDLDRLRERDHQALQAAVARGILHAEVSQ